MPAANDNHRQSPPLHIQLAAVDMLTAIWRALYPADRRGDLDARRDRR